MISLFKIGWGMIVLQFAFLWLILMCIVSVHEVSHGWVANRLGDPTAKNAGRLTLNPFAHVDLFGSVILPAVLFFTTHLFFGIAKPVPVNFARLRNPKRDMIWVGAAGPVSNFAMAIAGSLLVNLFQLASGNPLGDLLRIFVLINVILGVFNMLPIPPLDGSRVLMGLLPRRQAILVARIEPYGIFIVLALFFLGILAPVIIPVLHFVWRLIGMDPAWLKQFF